MPVAGNRGETPPVDPKDAVAVTQDLIRKPSVTPKDLGAIDTLTAILEPLGFTCTRLDFGEGEERIANLFARLGEGGPHICFAGHTDVVPPGDADAWSVDPFDGEVRDGDLIGRGACDMKGGIGAFVAAVASYLSDKGTPKGSISLLITGDEEGVAVNGTVKVVEWLKAKGETIDQCIVGEPTNPNALGDMIKIGRRGSLTTTLTVEGRQGHVAYPDRALNPVPAMLAALDHVTAWHLDDGNAHFQPSNLEVVTVDVGNAASNVIPARIKAVFNIRFNTEHTAAGLKDRIAKDMAKILASFGVSHSLDFVLTGEPFITEPGAFTEIVQGAVERATGRKPELSTSGGTSDARFIKDICPVLEFGLVGQTMHQIDEKVPVADLLALKDIYRAILDDYFA